MYEEYIPTIQRISPGVTFDLTQRTAVISIPLVILEGLIADFEG
jgi:hypothetical protein